LDRDAALKILCEMACRQRAAPKDWAGFDRAAFAIVSQLTFVTFDQTFQTRTRQLVLLKA
jgi:hypothetical protein